MPGGHLQAGDADPDSHIEGEGCEQDAHGVAAAVEAAQLAGQEEGQVCQAACAPGCVPCWMV